MQADIILFTLNEGNIQDFEYILKCTFLAIIKFSFEKCKAWKINKAGLY
jgi:hypothetical protein